jgi:hypothetical protein
MFDYEPGPGEPGSGNCLTEALQQAGYDVVSLPEWVKAEDLPNICVKLGLTFHGKGDVQIEKNTNLIAIYQTRPGIAHAVVVNDIEPLIKAKKKFFGIIELPK